MVQGGDAAAFEVVFERHADAALSLAYRIVGRRPQAEDVVQEAFLAVWRAGSGYDQARASVRTWVLGIVHHRAVDAVRRAAAHTVRDVGEGLAEQARAPEQTDLEVERREDAHEIRGALELLPGEQTRVIELAYYGGFTHTEIAAILGIPIGTVKGRMRLGLEKLREQLVTREPLQ